MAKQPKPRPATHRCGYIPWHVLMRQLGIDVETCPRCGGKMKTPDEMYFGTAANLPAQQAAARSNARAARLAANQAMSCERCLSQQTSLPVSEIPP